MLRTKRRDPRSVGGGICEIDLTRGFVALIDEGDTEMVSRFTWIADVRSESQVYCLAQAEPGRGSGKVRMHRLLMGCEKGDRRIIDHISGVGTDNRRCNLRFCSSSQNNSNRRSRSGTKGVKETGGCFDASITSNSHTFFLGRFRDIDSARRIYNVAALHLHGEFALLNDVEMNLPCMPKRIPKSGVIGVFRHGRKWMAVADNKYRGLYATIEEAANVHDAIVAAKCGPFARTNTFYGLISGVPQVNPDRAALATFGEFARTNAALGLLEGVQ